MSNGFRGNRVNGLANALSSMYAKDLDSDVTFKFFHDSNRILNLIWALSPSYITNLMEENSTVISFLLPAHMYNEETGEWSEESINQYTSFPVYIDSISEDSADFYITIGSKICKVPIYVETYPSTGDQRTVTGTVAWYAADFVT